MHPYVLISLLSSLAAGMLAGAIWARDPGNRGNRLSAALLAATTVWSLCDALSNTATTARAALEFLRWSCLGSLMVGPLAFHMLLTLEPKLGQRYGRWLRFTYASGLVGVLIAVATPFFWRGVVPAPWGWAGSIGPGVAISWAVVIPFPFAALIDWFRLERGTEKIDAWMGIAACVPALIATVTDFVLPTAGILFPRLGSTSLVAWGGIALWRVYRFRDPILAPHLFAQEILATLPDGVVLLRLDDTIRAANAKMGALVGIPADELMGRPISDFLVARGTPAAEPVRDARELALVQASGDTVDVSVDDAGLHDDGGNPLGRVVVIRDLREVVSLRSRLVTSGRLAAVGQLAAGIAHEINNPIAYVQSGINLLGEHWRVVAAAFEKSAVGVDLAERIREGEELISESREGLARVASIVRDVGGFSRNAEAEWVSADPNRLLDTAVRVAHPQLRHRANVERDYAELPLLRCIPQELMQVFLNLLLNAAQALTERGTIRLATRREDDRLVVEVADDGTGMDPATARQIFTPFFTTKPIGVGTGLGLSISKQIIEKHSGSITATSTPGAGTVFRIELPLGDGESDGEPRG